MNIDIYVPKMTLIHWLVAFICYVFPGYILGLDCGENALGMQNNAIPADKITASSGKAGDRARLNYTDGPSWCDMGNDAHPYLQIDLETPHIICAVSTQGDHQGKKWVKTFQLNSSDDGKTYYPYRENGNTQQAFYGNVDGSGIVKQILYQGIIARYLRILPMMYHGGVCMRAEIYGIQIQSVNLALNKTATQSSISYNGSASRAVDGNRDGNWLGGSCTHCAQVENQKEWWRVDLGKNVEVEEVSVFTRTHPYYGLRLWNYTFELHIGNSDGTSLVSNPRCGGQYGIIPAGSITIVCDPPMKGRYVTMIQKRPYQQLSLCEVEIYGHENPGPKIKLPPNGIDGRPDEKECKNMVNNVSNTWLIVDLGQSIPVHKIVIKNNHYAKDIFGLFQIHIGNNGLSDGDSTDPIIIGRTKEIGPLLHSIVLNQIMIGRYLTFKPKKQFSGLTHRLCKVEVYSKASICIRQGVGIANNRRAILNDKLTASTFYDNTRSAAKARLFGNSSWRPRDDDPNSWLQIDLGKIYYVCAVATQGDPNSDERTRKYKISWSRNNITWHFVRNKTSNKIMIFTGNRDRSSIIKHIFTTPLKAKIMRFHPVEKNKAYALRIEIYGVKIQGPSTPSLIGDSVLDPRYESHVDLVCTADKGLNSKIKWYHHDTDITSYSTGTERTGSIVKSTLRVNYTSADDIYDKYLCGEIVDRKRNCTSLDYICQVDYGFQGKVQAPRRVMIILGVPNPPIVTVQVSSISALIKMRPLNKTADQGNIIKYSVELNGTKKTITSLRQYNITGLKPYTVYSVRIKALSKIGESEWSKPVPFTTLQAGPSAAPKNVEATKTKDSKFSISWDKIPQEDANGNIVAYEIKWKPVELRRKRRSLLQSSQAAFENATKSPHLLEDLLLNLTYNVSIRGYTKAGPGPFSTPITINKAMETEKETGSKDESTTASLSSSSSSESFMLIIIVAAVVTVLIIIMIVMIVIIVVRKRNKKRKEKEKQVHYAAQASEPDAERSLIETNEDRVEQEQEDQNNIEVDKAPEALYGNLLNPESSKGPIPVEQFVEYMRKAGKDENEILTKEFENIENGQQFPALVARKAVNKVKNRYGNIVPYDHCRVVLEKVEEDEDSDYINASYIRGFDERHISYIASQGPVSKTVVDFWRMIWQEKTSVIIMLTGLIEGHKNKCEKYWPDDCDTYLDISVQLQKTEVFSDYSIRSFFLTKTNTKEQRCVFQYHFTAWPDKGVPQYATQLLAFRRRLVTDTAMVCPWVVHCSAGVGRTGAFLAVDAMLRQAQEKKTIDIFNFVKTMRENRPYMVQTSEQYIFVHSAILEYLTCGITEIRAQQLKEEMNKLAKVDENENLSGYEMEFKHLSNVCPPVQDYEITAGSNPCNNIKNRFPNIVPLDKARVFLQSDVDEDGANYINASFANGYRQKHAYILTQAPLDNTITDFWKMIYDDKLETIVMLNNLQEENANYPQYWPPEGSEQFGDITVEITQEEKKDSVTSRTFTLKHNSDGSDKGHEVRHYQHTDWSDGSVPSNVGSALTFIERLERSQQQSGNKSIVVQCSDGVGRSGTLCTILSLLDRVKTEQMVDVFQTVKALRISRPGAVETAVQYRFCFELVMSYLDSFSDYSNFND